MVDKILVLRKLNNLDQYVSQIREYSQISLSEYSRDWKTQRIVERTLQIMIETCLDISTHIVSDQGFRSPENYADLFRILNENEIIDNSLLASCARMAKFRNLVVHFYEKVAPEIIVNILKNNIDDFLSFKHPCPAAHIEA